MKAVRRLKRWQKNVKRGKHEPSNSYKRHGLVMKNKLTSCKGTLNSRWGT
jgi:hypothetical protein